MKYLNEFRDPATAQKLLQAIRSINTKPWTIMEVCGGQTHSIIRHGIDQLLPNTINLIHGPGCPVCVTPLEYIDKALAIAGQRDIIFCSFGDMLRVPGSTQDLLTLKAQGADIRIVYSPLDALQLAQKNPDRDVVFFGVGFETTAPATALAAFQAQRQAIDNFSLLVCHVRVPPVIKALLEAPDNAVQGFLAAGHVCAIMGYHEYPPLAEQFQVPIVVTGFEPVDILQGLLSCIQQLEQGRFGVVNKYSRVVKRQGNASAQALLKQVYAIVNQDWRGLGMIEAGGLALKQDYNRWNAEYRYNVSSKESPDQSACLSGQVLTGRIKPAACPEFGCRCTPEHPLGATMVSSEGACAAYFRYRQHSAYG